MADGEPARFATPEEAVEWLEPYMMGAEDMGWLRSDAVLAVCEAYPTEAMVRRIMDRYKVHRRQVYYMLRTARDWPPETRYRDHSWAWHKYVSEAALVSGSDIGQIAEVCLGHGPAFVAAVLALWRRRRRKALDEGADPRKIKDTITFVSVAAEVAEQPLPDILRLEARECPTCGQVVPEYMWWRLDAVGGDSGDDRRC